jgi:gas vesicle protein
MCDHKKGSSFAAGLLVGGVVGAAAALFFGTKKGREWQNKIKKQYPEVFENLSENLSKVKEDVEDKVQEIRTATVQEMAPFKKRFVKNGKRL